MTRAAYDAIFSANRFSVKSRWHSQLTAWLQPKLKRGSIGRLQREDTSKLYLDDPAWSDMLANNLRSSLDDTKNCLADYLASLEARVFHGCRASDAKSYQRDGLLVHDREKLIEAFRTLVENDDRLENLREKIDEITQRVCSKVDAGRCFVVLDERALLRDAAHYLIYGSELICSFLKPIQRAALLDSGVPTLLHVNLPLSRTTVSQRTELAECMLHEWTRLAADFCNEPVIELDFTFALTEPIPGSLIVGHYHPTELRDPLRSGLLYRSPRTTCPSCSV